MPCACGRSTRGILSVVSTTTWHLHCLGSSRAVSCASLGHEADGQPRYLRRSCMLAPLLLGVLAGAGQALAADSLPAKAEDKLIAGAAGVYLGNAWHLDHHATYPILTKWCWESQTSLKDQQPIRIATTRRDLTAITGAMLSSWIGMCIPGRHAGEPALRLCAAAGEITPITLIIKGAPWSPAR